MPAYRIYIVGRDGSFLGAAEVVECVDDNEAIGTASQIASGLGAEIWDQKRFVAQLPASAWRRTHSSADAQRRKHYHAGTARRHAASLKAGDLRAGQHIS